MGRKLRVFVSSTMKDMPNERDAVVQRLDALNCEPVNAEDLLPTGAGSWEVIEDEIESSDLFVLILGEKYGWKPDQGHGAGTGRSVTHLEFEAARRRQIPVLVFLKRLSSDADRSSDDAKRRDAFRKEVTDYASGYFRGREFELARDLAEQVGKAVVNVITDEYLKGRIASRSQHVYAMASRMAPHGDGAAGRGKVSVPPELARDVEGGKAVLFAGTGISLAAGLPRSPAFIERLAELVRRHEGSYTASPVGSAFVSTATDLEVVGGRPQLTAAVAELVKPPQGVRPTAAHRAAVRTFDRIITTNFDCLFEDACAEQGIRCTVVRDDPEIPERFPGGPVILKLHGSVDVPSTLALTEEDFALFARKRPRMCRLVVELLRSRSVLVVGTSLRDPSIIALFAEAGDQVSGFFVVPNPWNFTPDRVKRWNLRVIPTDADTLFDQLAPGAMPLGN